MNKILFLSGLFDFRAGIDFAPVGDFTANSFFQKFGTDKAHFAVVRLDAIPDLIRRVSGQTNRLPRFQHGQDVEIVRRPCMALTSPVVW